MHLCRVRQKLQYENGWSQWRTPKETSDSLTKTSFLSLSMPSINQSFEKNRSSLREEIPFSYMNLLGLFLH